MKLFRSLFLAIITFIRFLCCHLITYFPLGSKWKMERICKITLEILTGYEFSSVRPDWLKNPLTGRNLELDCYNDTLKLALEYNGKQHYVFTPRFHKNEHDLELQIYRDELKQSLCDQNGVTLIIVPYTISEQELCSYILRKLRIVQQYRKRQSQIRFSFSEKTIS